MLDSKHNIQYYKQVHQSQNDLQNKWHLIMYIICHGQIRLKTNLHYCQNETNKKITILIMSQLLSPPFEHMDKICAQKRRQEPWYIFLHKKSRIIISLQQLTPNNPWELCNWMLLGLLWACKIEPVVLSAVYHYLSSAHLCPTAFWIRDKNEISPLNHRHLFWKRQEVVLYFRAV